MTREERMIMELSNRLIKVEEYIDELKKLLIKKKQDGTRSKRKPAGESVGTEK